MSSVRAYFVAAVLSLLAAGVADASVISGFSASGAAVQSHGGAFSVPAASNTAAPGAANTFIRFTAPTFAHDVQPATSTSNYVNLTANVTDLKQPMSLRVSQFDGGEASQYYFTVTMTNNTFKPHPISPVTFALVNIDTGDFANTVFDNRPGSAHSSSYQTMSTVTPHSITFGGVNGGGGELSVGQTATFHFSVLLPEVSSGNFFLTMTPNPEPSSLALAGVVGLGGLVMARRRKKAAAAAI